MKRYMPSWVIAGFALVLILIVLVILCLNCEEPRSIETAEWMWRISLSAISAEKAKWIWWISLLAIPAVVAVWGIGFILFPRIVVTFKDHSKGGKSSLWCDGRKIETPKAQISIQVWRSGIYDVFFPDFNQCKKADTYEKRVCHLEAPDHK
jgi:hypothetical protein